MKKKAIFVDRDGTIIQEPADEQIDSLEKLEFVPGAISGLRSLMGLGYELVMASNQDGLGTPSFPESTFWPACPGICAKYMPRCCRMLRIQRTMTPPGKMNAACAAL